MPDTQKPRRTRYFCYLCIPITQKARKKDDKKARERQEKKQRKTCNR